MSLNFSTELLARKPYLVFFQDLSREITTNDYSLCSAKNSQEYYVSYGERKLASTISPLTQATRLLSNTSIRETDLCIILGLGNPHLAFELNQQRKEGEILLYIDASSSILPALGSEILEELLQPAGRHLFTGEESEDLLWNYLEALPLERLSGIRFFRNQASLNLAPDFYINIETKVQKIFSSRMSDLLTKFEFERIWIRNTVSNTLHFFENPPRFRLEELNQKFAGIPAMLVSAGPSLRENCEFIKEIRDKVFLFSCDTSLKVLLSNQIIPDGVMTLDAQTHSFFHFMGTDLQEIPVFADMVASPLLLRHINTVSIIHSITAKYQTDVSGRPIREVTAGSSLAETILGPIGDVQSGGSVATSAFDLLKNLGFSPIFLIGQDLAYSGREIHSTGTHHNEKWLTLINRKKSLEGINEAIIQKRKLKEVPSCSGGNVLTDYVLEIYRQWFEDSALKVDFPIYNINEKGTFLQNIQNIHTEKAKELLSDFSPHSYPWRNLPPWQVSPKEVKDKRQDKLLEESLDSIQNLSQKIKKWETDTLEYTELLKNLDEETEKIPFLAQILRKTLVYTRRQENKLNNERKISLLLTSLKKEIRYLKKALLI
ncbi:MAG: motility associated factor glycosyltransferase family protein [Leptospiraceae bacterium]|nr:motility associated factor glycosyltransferase family protein [Leptospiraceae bacterium]MCP5500138.1 motility associated factor glycosyltransferase family protein [Leptospiraceae bacterium]